MSSNSTEPKIAEETWNKTLVVGQAINILFMAIVFWILFSMIIYGTKTGRWKKRRGASSMNSGMIYTTCVVTVALIAVRLIIMEILYQAPRMDKTSGWCNMMCHAVTISYGVCTYGAYFFVYMRQWLIYNNPFVKGKLGEFAIWGNRIVLLFLTGSFVALGCLYVLPVSYQRVSYGCILAPPKSDGFLYKNTSDILLGITFVIIQVLILCLSAYPAVRVKFEASSEIKNSRQSLDSSASTPARKGPPFFLRCKELFTSGGDTNCSPIKMAVRRTLVCSLILVVTAIILVGVDILAVNRDFPIAVAQTIYDVGSIVNIFAMLSSFIFAGEILTLCCPKVDMNRRKNRVSYARGQSENKQTGEENV